MGGDVASKDCATVTHLYVSASSAGMGLLTVLLLRASTAPSTLKGKSAWLMASMDSLNDSTNG